MENFLRLFAVVVVVTAFLSVACERVDEATPAPDAPVPAESTSTAAGTATSIPSSILTPLPPTVVSTPVLPTSTPTSIATPLPEPPWDVIEDLGPSIVKVAAGTRSGTGVIVRVPPIGRSTILTTLDTVEGAQAISVTVHDGAEYPAELIEEDAARNLAYIDICCSRSLEPFDLERQSFRIVDLWGFMAGFAEDEEEISATRAKIVSLSHETVASIIGMDTATPAGVSGGVLLTADGRVVGVLNDAIGIHMSEVTAADRGYAITATTAVEVIEEAGFSSYYEQTPIHGSEPTSVSGKPLDPDAEHGGVLQIAFTRKGSTYSTWEESGGIAAPAMQPLHNMLIQPRTWGADTDFENDAFFELHPDLAAAWRVSSSGKDYIFDLREDIEWSDGTPITCTDVKWSFDTIRIGQGLHQNPRGIFLDAIHEISCEGNNRVIFSTREPSTFTLDALAWPYNIIRPAHVYQGTNLNLLRSNVPEVTSGPFRLVSAKEDERYVFERDPNYWDAPLPYLDGIELRFMATDAIPPALRTGRLHIGRPHGYTGTTADTLMRECPEDMCRVWNSTVSPSMSPAVFLHQQREPWNDPAVNEAVALAIDNERYISEARNGWAALPSGCGFYPSSIWAMPADRCGQIPGYGDVVGISTPAEDKQRARQILAGAGYRPGGIDLSITVLDANRADAEALVDDLEDIGINATINAGDGTQTYSAWGIGNFDAGVHSFWINGVDPQVTMFPHFNPYGDFNYNRYMNPDYTHVFGQTHLLLDPFARRELAWDAMEIALRDQAKIIVAHDVYAQIVSADVRGFMPAVNYLAAYGPQNRYDHVWLEE